MRSYRRSTDLEYLHAVTGERKPEGPFVVVGRGDREEGVKCRGEECGVRRVGRTARKVGGRQLDPREGLVAPPMNLAESKERFAVFESSCREALVETPEVDGSGIRRRWPD